MFELAWPIQILDQADAPTLHRALKNQLVHTAAGPGEYWPSSSSESAVVISFAGDSLAVNFAAFALEQLAARSARQRSRTQGHQPRLLLLLFTRCLLHQLSLAKRPAMLCVPGVCSTLVRMGNLFSTRRWRTRFRESLETVIRESFKHIPCDVLPAEAAGWRSRTEQVLRSTSAAAASPELDKQLVDFLNGSTQSMTTISHFCLPMCGCGGGNANGRSLSLSTAIQLIQMMLADIPATPLLYRWKGWEPALAWAGRATMLHSLLPRTLQRMTGHNKDVPHDDAATDTAIPAACTADDITNVNASYSQQQSARADAVSAFFAADPTGSGLARSHLLTSPYTRVANKLFTTPEDLDDASARCHSGARRIAAQTGRQRRQQTRERFISMACGSLGQDVGALNRLRDSCEELIRLIEKGIGSCPAPFSRHVGSVIY